MLKIKGLLTQTENKNETVKIIARKPIPDVDTTQFEHLSNKFDICELQKQDPFCRAVYDCVSEGKIPNGIQAKLTQVVSEDCFIDHGIVYKLKLNTSLKLIKPKGYQLLVPKAIQEEILKQAHLDTAHANLNTFIGFLRDHFYWPKLLSSATRYINECQICSQFGKGHLFYKTSYVYCGEAFNHIEMDVAGPFNVSSSGSKYILTIVDIFSGYLVNLALKTTSAKEICEHLLNTYTNLWFSFASFM